MTAHSPLKLQLADQLADLLDGLTLDGLVTVTRLGVAQFQIEVAGENDVSTFDVTVVEHTGHRARRLRR